MKVRLTYDGKYPNLCAGTLCIVLVDEYSTATWDFGRCLHSCGNCYWDNVLNDWDTSDGPWTIDVWPNMFPMEHKQLVLDAVNAQIRFGCCGGCS